MSGAILVTGGAGYIGSHIVLALADAGRPVVVLDDLSSGWRWAVPPHVPFVHAGIEDRAAVCGTIAQHGVTSVIHMAASILVGESVERPLDYYRNNSSHSLALVEALCAMGVSRLLFSSTAAVYGVPQRVPIAEDAPLAPISPYGRSKLAVEWLLRDVGRAKGWRLGILRYFNVAGADALGRAGQSTKGATHLVKMIAEVAAGQRSHVSILGTDYPTRDGTGVRDYVHVEDLARAHLMALDALEAEDRSFVYNVGDGHGFSVREVLAAADHVLESPVPQVEAPRRPGDPAELVADPSRLSAELGWRPAPGGIERMIADAIRWERQRAVTPPAAAA